MIGVITAQHDAMVKLQVLGTAGRAANVDVLLDTGFNHDLTLPAAIVNKLNLEFISPTEATVAGDIAVPANYFRAYVLWDGSPRHISVLELEGVPLLGMGLLRRHRVTLDVVVDGRVTIEPLR